MTELSARCPHCNRSLPPESRFCPRCGLPTTEGDTRTQATAKERPFWLDVVDKSWDFFASTRVAVVLIILLAAASIGGTLVEQESLYQDWRPPYLYYPSRYGPTLGPLLMKLGLTHAYSSVWYMALIWLLVINLIIGSLHRLIPLHRVLSRPQTQKSEQFVRRQPVALTRSTTAGGLDEVAATLKKRGFRIWRHAGGLHADRGRLGRYGPYIIHIGLILTALAATLKVVPGFDITKDLWLADGETAQVSGLNWSIKDDRFILDLYPNGTPKRYATEMHILDANGQEVKPGTTEVNHPVNHDQYDIYQASFRREYGTATFDVKVGEGDKAQVMGTVTLDLRRPESTYQVAPNLALRIDDFYNDFTTDAQGQPGNLSPNVSHPAFRATFLDGAGKEQGAVAVGFAQLPTTPTPNEKIEPPGIAYNGPLSLAYKEHTIRWYSGLRLHKDLTVPYFFSGVAIILLGLTITFFIFHQQVWVQETEGQLVIGARAHKNTYTLGKYLQKLLRATPLVNSQRTAAELPGPLGTRGVPEPGTESSES